MLNTNGSTSRGNARMIVSVVMSNVTRVPFTNFDLSSLVLHPTTYRGPLLALTMKRSSSNCRKTSPIICPIDCSAFKSSSVLSNAFRTLRNSSLAARTRPSSSLCCNNSPEYFLNASRLGSGGAGVGVVISASVPSVAVMARDTSECQRARDAVRRSRRRRLVTTCVDLRSRSMRAAVVASQSRGVQCGLKLKRRLHFHAVRRLRERSRVLARRAHRLGRGVGRTIAGTLSRRRHARRVACDVRLR
mmetsp:Transcript_1406/g.5136  ORF Transcript_1406/g.5136 Transcript_1406/m.5136 type:complete len:246 (-) Transcript_1406:982-1719(-)